MSKYIKTFFKGSKWKTVSSSREKVSIRLTRTLICRSKSWFGTRLWDSSTDSRNDKMSKKFHLITYSYYAELADVSVGGKRLSLGVYVLDAPLFFQTRHESIHSLYTFEAGSRCVNLTSFLPYCFAFRGRRGVFQEIRVLTL